MEKQQKICVSVFVRTRAGNALLVRRSQHEKFLPGYYEMPGGKDEFGESLEDALVRECHEEVGLDVVPGKPYKAFSYVSEDGNRHTVDISYDATLRDPNQVVTLSGAHDDYRWVSEAEVTNYLMTDEMRECVLAGFRHVQGGGQ